MSIPVKRNCYNGFESYGEICVRCGCCSTDKKIRYKARLELHERLLDRSLHFNQWHKGWIRVQKRNIKKNITWNKYRFAIYKRLLREVSK
jgi:hypothetical protein